MIFAYPTESFYALGVRATDAKAIRELFRVKHREQGKPVALIAGNWRQVVKFFYLNRQEHLLAKRYWPTGLTLLLRPKKAIASRTLTPLFPPSDEGGRKGSRGERRIGVRIPAHAGARRLALKIGAPITATSANISGQPATKLAAKVKKDFPGILIMPGRCGRQSKPSTVAQIVNGKIKIIRHGSVHPVRSASGHKLSNVR